MKNKANIVGICIEDLDKFDRNRIPFPLGISSSAANSHKGLYDVKTKSAMVFKDMSLESQHSLLEIFKDDEGIHVYYHLASGSNEAIEESDDIHLPVVNDGVISLTELGILIDSLEERYSGDEFIRAVILELSKFAEAVSINNGFSIRGEDVLSPEALIGESIDDIAMRILVDRDDYFEWAEKAFRRSADLDLARRENRESFRIKPVK